MTQRAFGYRRVSTGDQSLGLAAQHTAIEQKAVALGLTLVETFTDEGLSGGLALEQRPALLAAIDSLRKGDVLLIAKRDRLGRDVLNVAMIERLVERKGARIVSAAGEGTDSAEPAAVLMRQIIDVFAQYERAVIRSRTKSALQAKRAKRERVGSVPFGFQLDADNQTLVEDPAEQRVLDVMRALKAQRRSVRSITDELNAQGYRSRRGQAWRFQRVAKILIAATI